MLKYKEDEIEKAKNRVVQGEEDISLWKMKGDKYIEQVLTERDMEPNKSISNCSVE